MSNHTDATVDTVPLLPGPVVWETREVASPLERLLAVLATHVSIEEESLVAYREYAASFADPIVTSLMKLILDDEDRHHRLLRQMAARLRDDLDWTRSPEALPQAKPNAAPPSEVVIGATRAYLKDEREGARQLRRLAKEMPDLYGGLFSLLLEVMARDSEKHEQILAFILRRLTTAG